jgi:hypothetical protein
LLLAGSLLGALFGPEDGGFTFLQNVGEPPDYTAGLSNAAPVIYFPGALFYSAGFNIRI